jgi:RNA polymerase sigma-70 factor (ECF subfamily)
MNPGVLVLESGSGQFGAARTCGDDRLVAAVPPETLVKSALLTPAEQRSLVDRIRQGDSVAEEVVVLRFDRRIRALAVNRIRDREAARDLAQETLIQVLSALRGGQLRDAERLGAFIFGIARNVINNYLRSRGRQPAEEPIDDLQIAGDEEDSDLADRRALVRRALQRLDATDRRIMSMTLLEGWKPGEIASTMGLSVDVVRARKSRALKKVTDRVQRWLRIGS